MNQLSNGLKFVCVFDSYLYKIKELLRSYKIVRDL